MLIGWCFLFVLVFGGGLFLLLFLLGRFGVGSGLLASGFGLVCLLLTLGSLSVGFGLGVGGGLLARGFGLIGLLLTLGLLRFSFGLGVGGGLLTRGLGLVDLLQTLGLLRFSFGLGVRSTLLALGLPLFLFCLHLGFGLRTLSFTRGLLLLRLRLVGSSGVLALLLGLGPILLGLFLLLGGLFLPNLSLFNSLRPRGFALLLGLLDGRRCKIHRATARRQAGSFLGCACPSQCHVFDRTPGDALHV